MKLTKFEKVLFHDENADKEKEFIPKALYYFHFLLMKVEVDPYRQWTHDLLRNYVDAFYSLCININQRNVEGINPRKKEEISQKPINIYTDDDSHITLFFTGLYSPITYQGMKNGLYFVYNSKDIYVMTRKELMETKKFAGRSLLNNIIHRDSFENELWNKDDLIIDKIQVPEVVTSVAANKLFEYDNEKKQLKPINEFHEWLHILYDGSDNLPTEFVKSFFDLSYENMNLQARNEYRKEKIAQSIKAGNEGFEFYQKILIETFRSQIDKKDELPILFYKKKSQYNYLLPMYLQNSTKPDFCIVLACIDNSKIWKPITSLNMDEVYCDIRVFGKDAILSVRDWW